MFCFSYHSQKCGNQNSGDTIDIIEVLIICNQFDRQIEQFDCEFVECISRDETNTLLFWLRCAPTRSSQIETNNKNEKNNSGEKQK